MNIERIKQLAALQLTIDEIAAEIGVPYAEVYRAGSHAGLVFDERNYPRVSSVPAHTLPKSTNAEMYAESAAIFAALVETGMTANELAGHYGVKVGNIYNYARNHGLRLKRKVSDVKLGKNGLPDFIARAEAGATAEELAGSYQVTPAYVWAYAKSNGVKLSKQRSAFKPLRGSRNAERDAAMLARAQAGDTLEAIAQPYGLSKERVRQVLKHMGYCRAAMFRSEEIVRIKSNPTIGVTRLSEIRAMAGGKTAAELAELLNISMSYIYTFAREHNIPFKPSPYMATRVQERRARNKEIAELRKSGIPTKEIAEAYGLTCWSVTQACHQQGLYLRGKRSPNKRKPQDELAA